MTNVDKNFLPLFCRVRINALKISHIEILEWWFSNAAIISNTYYSSLRFRREVFYIQV